MKPSIVQSLLTKSILKTELEVPQMLKKSTLWLK